MNKEELAAWKSARDARKGRQSVGLGATYLMTACRDTNLEVVEALLNEEVDINAQAHGSTALIESIEASRYSAEVGKIGLKIVQLLINNGADVNVTPGSLSPVLTATVYRLPEILKLLIKHGADVNYPTTDGYTALQLAGSLRLGKRIIKILQDGGATGSVSDLQDAAVKPIWGAKAPKIVSEGSYDDMASGFQIMEIDRLNQTLKKNGIDDASLRRKICKEYAFDNGNYKDGGWLRSGDRILWPELCFAERKSMGEGPIQTLHVVSNSFSFHEYAFGDVDWYFDDHNEDITEIEHGCI